VTRNDVVETAWFPAAMTSAGEARRFVRSSLNGSIADDLADVIVLLTSELVSNAVLHAHSPLQVTVTLPDATLRVAVTDQSDRWPVVRQINESGEGGRGMVLVEQLSDAWGVVPMGTGKTVWFSVGLRPA
jgi:anti-sigma regulatory factor (Ser/Thr protein kinase)